MKLMEKIKGPRYALNCNRLVEVYRNLHQDCWSVRQNGLVKAHTDKITILLPEFVVQPSGRQHVLASGRKGVHAWIKGMIYKDDFRLFVGGGTAVKYVPQRFPFFTKPDDSPIKSGHFARLSYPKVKVWS
jgi:hypothetical protein